MTVGLIVSGCAALPTSGSVHVGRALPGVAGVENDEIRAFPSGPLPGETRTGVVTGFLDALIDNDNNYGVARLFLAPGTDWNSTSGITLYDQSSELVTAIGSHDVQIEMHRVGVIDPHGEFRVAPGEVTATLRLDRHGGQWRISHLPSGVLLSTADAQRSLQEAELFYLNEAQTRLVPAPVLVELEQPGIATTLVDALLDQPPRSIAAATVTAAPEGLDLIGNVPIGADGVAEVNLSGGSQAISPSGLQRLSAQIVWTLRQVPGVTAVRLLDNGTPLTDIGVPQVQRLDAWPQFDPDAPPTTRGALLSRRGTIVGVGRSVPPALGNGRFGSPAASANGSEVAALVRHRGRTSVVVGSTIARVRPLLSGSVLSPPVFGPTGDAYVVRGTGFGSAVFELAPGHPARRVGLPAIVRELGLSELAVSRDGSRVALVVGPPGDHSLMIGALSTRHREPRIIRPATVIPAGRNVAGVAWADASAIVTTARTTGGRRAVIRTDLNGYRVHTMSDAGLPANPSQVAAAPGQPILATAGGSVWTFSGERWRRVSTGGGPSYAG